MKKLIIILLLFCTSLVTKAELKNAGFSFGVSNVYFSRGNDIGYNFGVTLNNVYIDVMSNLNSYDFSQGLLGPLTDVRAQHIICGINVGYELSVLGSKKFHVIPTVGFYRSKDTYRTLENSLEYKEAYTNLGIHLRYYVTPHIGITLGTNNIEQSKLSIYYKL